jgi:hypothetical protein
MDNTESTIEEVKPVETVEPAKPRRGRPPASEKTGDAGTPKATAPKTRTPRKKAAPSDQAIEPETLAKQLQGVHVMIAMMTQSPEMQLSEPESLELAKAVSGVCAEYNLSLNGKTGAMIQLLGAGAMIYLPRLVMIKQRKTKEAQEREMQDTIHNPIDGLVVQGVSGESVQ